MNIFETIKSEIDNFIDNPIEVVSGYTFDQYNTIKRNHLYYNSQFEDNSLILNREKIFDNIVTYGCEIEATLLDFDTKDSKLLALSPASTEEEFLLGKELEYYLKENNLDVLYNDLAHELPVYGSVVVKNSDPVPLIVDLRRLFLDPTVNRIWESRFITLKHYLTAQQLRDKKGIWDDAVIDKMLKDKSYLDDEQTSYENNEREIEQTESPYYIVYERYGEVPEAFLKEKGKEDKWLRSLFITTDPDRAEPEVLFKSEWKKPYPFKDAHRRKTRGRWLGISAIEEKFPHQERTNELANQKRIAMEISTLQLFQTSDAVLMRNVLTDKMPGDILRKSIGGEGLLPVDNRVKNFGEYQQEEMKWREGADRMSFSSDILRGEIQSASTPATNAVISNNNSTSVHLNRRENLAQMIRDMFNDWILPKFKKTINKEHVIKFIGDALELQAFDQKAIENIVNQEAINTALSGQKVDYEMIRAEVEQQFKKKGQSRYAKMLEGMFKDMDMRYDLMIDGQQKNLQTSLNNMFTVLQTLSANPAVLDDPRIKTMFYEFMKGAGISPEKLELADAQRQQQVQQNPMQMMGQLQAQMPQQPNQ